MIERKVTGFRKLLNDEVALVLDDGSALGRVTYIETESTTSEQVPYDGLAWRTAEHVPGVRLRVTVVLEIETPITIVV